MVMQSSAGAPSAYTKWVQLVVCTAITAVASGLQYNWNLFAPEIATANSWSNGDVRSFFDVFILFQTWPVLVIGFLIDRFGVRQMLWLAGACIGASWVLNAHASTMTEFWVNSAIGGLGVGIATAAAYGNVLRWFTEQRGLAIGLTAAGYGLGTMATVGVTEGIIQAGGYQTAFLWVGTAQGIAVFALAFLAKASPSAAWSDDLPRGYRTFFWVLWGLLKSPAFWLLYVMFMLVAAGGLTLIKDFKTITHDFGFGGLEVSILWFAGSVVVMSQQLDRLTNGISRPLFGFISDRIGRAETMCIAFFLEGAGIASLALIGPTDPVWFVLLSGVVFLAWGEIFSLFPAMLTDTFGPRFAATNYGVLYTAKGMGTLFSSHIFLLALVPGDWTGVLLAIAVCDVLVGLTAVFVLKPVAARTETYLR